MEQKHTPGPWMQSYTDAKHVIKNVNGQGIHIANVAKDEDAELIARAPELLQQVAELKAEVEKLTDKLRFADKHIALLQGKEATELSRLREEQRELVEALREAKVCIIQNTPNSWVTPDWMNLMKRIESLLSKFEVPNV